MLKPIALVSPTLSSPTVLAPAGVGDGALFALPDALAATLPTPGQAPAVPGNLLPLVPVAPSAADSEAAAADASPPAALATGPLPTTVTELLLAVPAVEAAPPEEPQLTPPPPPPVTPHIMARTPRTAPTTTKQPAPDPDAAPDEGDASATDVPQDVASLPSLPTAPVASATAALPASDDGASSDGDTAPLAGRDTPAIVSPHASIPASDLTTAPHLIAPDHDAAPTTRPVEAPDTAVREIATDEPRTADPRPLQNVAAASEPVIAQTPVATTPPSATPVDGAISSTTATEPLATAASAPTPESAEPRPAIPAATAASAGRVDPGTEASDAPSAEPVTRPPVRARSQEQQETRSSAAAPAAPIPLDPASTPTRARESEAQPTRVRPAVTERAAEPTSAAQLAIGSTADAAPPADDVTSSEPAPRVIADAAVSQVAEAALPIAPTPSAAPAAPLRPREVQATAQAMPSAPAAVIDATASNRPGSVTVAPEAPLTGEQGVPLASRPLATSAATDVPGAAPGAQPATVPAEVQAPAPAIAAETPRTATRIEAAPIRVALLPSDAPPLVAGTTAPAFRLFAAAIHAARIDEREPASPIQTPTLAPATSLGNAPAVADSHGGALDMADHRWPQAMVDRIETLREAAGAARDAASTSIRLVPDALGAIDVAVRTEGDTVHVHFNAEQAQTRALLADAQPRLAELAEARGMRLAGGDVGTGAQGQRQPPQGAAPLPAAPRPVARDDESDLQTATRIA